MLIAVTLITLDSGIIVDFMGQCLELRQPHDPLASTPPAAVAEWMKFAAPLATCDTKSTAKRG